MKKWKVHERRKSGMRLSYSADGDKRALAFFRRVADAECPEQMEDERQWFEAHPSETVRHREAYPSEFVEFNFPAGAPPIMQVEVVQIGPGVRIRRGYWFIDDGAIRR